MNKYLKIGLISALVGATLAGGIHIYKEHPYNGKEMSPVSNGYEQPIDKNVKAEDNATFRLVKTNKTMA